MFFSVSTQVSTVSNPIGSGLKRASLTAAPWNIARHDCYQVRHATLIKRPKRPYTFTQLVTLSDGSMFMHRTTSPLPVYKATKDIRNSPVWNPSSQSLANVEEDEAGKLRAFRTRFGRGWDADAPEYATNAEGVEPTKTHAADQQPNDFLLDLISDYGANEIAKSQAAKQPAPPVPKGKSKK